MMELAVNKSCGVSGQVPQKEAVGEEDMLYTGTIESVMVERGQSVGRRRRRYGSAYFVADCGNCGRRGDGSCCRKGIGHWPCWQVEHLTAPSTYLTLSFLKSFILRFMQLFYPSCLF